MEMLHKKAAIQKTFNNIGKTNGSKPPEGTSNTLGAAYELFVSKELKSAAEKRYDMAKEKAKEQGIIDESKVSEGSEVTTWQSEFFDISLKQSSSSLSLDKTLVKNRLMTDLNMSEDEANKFLVKCSKPRKGAVNINISLKG